MQKGCNYFLQHPSDMNTHTQSRASKFSPTHGVKELWHSMIGPHAERSPTGQCSYGPGYCVSWFHGWLGNNSALRVCSCGKASQPPDCHWCDRSLNTPCSHTLSQSFLPGETDRFSYNSTIVLSRKLTEEWSISMLTHQTSRLAMIEGHMGQTTILRHPSEFGEL